MHNTINSSGFKTMDEVLEELDRIIEETVKENNFWGIFAYVYRRTTAQIKKAVEDKLFEDNERMVLFDIAFAQLYIDAYHQYKNDKVVNLAWQRAFEFSKRRLSIIQHILLGMNAHINLDLGVAAAYISKGQDIDPMKKDFVLINQILAELVDEIQLKISRVSPLMFLLDWLGRREDEKMINFNIWKARNYAWKVACTLVRLESEQEWQERIHLVDREVAHLAYQIYKPPLPLVRIALKTMGWFEERKVDKIINKLHQH